MIKEYFPNAYNSVYYMKVSWKRADWRWVGLGSGRVRLFERMGRAYTPKLLQIMLSSTEDCVSVGYGKVFGILDIVHCRKHIWHMLHIVILQSLCSNIAITCEQFNSPSGGTSQKLANNSLWVQTESFMAAVGFEPTSDNLARFDHSSEPARLVSNIYQYF